MKKILITGLGVGKNFGVCDACNMNYVELLVNPEVLLWAEKICVPKEDYFSDDTVGKQCRLVFSILEENNLIYRYSKKDVDKMRMDNVIDLAETDIINIERENPERIIKKDVLELSDASEKCEEQYCIPWIASVYSAMIAADEIKANCLFSEREENFIKYMFCKKQDVNNAFKLNEIYREILSCKLPNEPIINQYGMLEKCNDCSHTKLCNDSYLLDVEKKLLNVLSLRNNDEMVQLRSVIDDVIRKKNMLLEPYNTEDIIRDLYYKKNYIEKNINLRFKKVERFSNLITCVSIPLTFIGAQQANLQMAFASGITAGAATIANNAVEFYKSKNNWVNFINKNCK